MHENFNFSVSFVYEDINIQKGGLKSSNSGTCICQKICK